MTPQPSSKRGRQLLNQVSTELGEGHYMLEILKGYSVDVARQKNSSFDYFVQKTSM